MTSAEQGAAAPTSRWHHPQGEHDGLSNVAPAAPQSALDPLRQGSTMDVGDSTSTDGKQNEGSGSANPSKDWKHPAGSHAGLTDSQATAPQSLIAKANEHQGKSDEDRAAEAGSANPGKSWQHPQNPSDGLSGDSPNAPASRIDQAK